MTRRFHRAGIPARGQRGFALIAIISLIVLMSAYLIVNALNRTSGEVAIEREQRSMDALRQAKAALIAYAASEQWQLYKGQATDQPGGLPCPDLNDNGASETSCNSALSLVGRLPWTTIGSDDLRDASGERLWYAVSSNFRRLSGTTVINSDTQGLLTVTGSAPASNIVAIVFAPGQPVGAQNRTTGHNDPASYLEGFTAGANDYTFTTNALPSDTFNDRLLVITQAELMAVVEPVVAARIERDIKPLIVNYSASQNAGVTGWSAFPFPSSFSPNPGTSGAGTTRAQGAFAGSTAATNGLLPITASSYPWVAGSGSVVSTGGTGHIGAVSCATIAVLPGPGYQCTFKIDEPHLNNPSFKMQAQVSNAGLSFAVLPKTTDVVSTQTLSSQSIVGTLSATGTGTIAFNATYLGSCNCGGARALSFTVTIPDLLPSTLTSAADPSAGWFISNEWYRQTYYAVSPGWLPGGGGTCNALPGTPSCLTVNNLPQYYISTNYNLERVILVFAGRALNGSARPSSSLGDYLEGQNATPADFIYEHRSGTPTSINDRVVVVSPP